MQQKHGEDASMFGGESRLGADASTKAPSSAFMQGTAPAASGSAELDEMGAKETGKFPSKVQETTFFGSMGVGHDPSLAVPESPTYSLAEQQRLAAGSRLTEGIAAAQNDNFVVQTPVKPGGVDFSHVGGGKESVRELTGAVTGRFSSPEHALLQGRNQIPALPQSTASFKMNLQSSMAKAGEDDEPVESAKKPADFTELNAHQPAIKDQSLQGQDLPAGA